MEPTTAPPRAWRDLDNAVVAGVCAGVADHLGLKREGVRIAFGLLALVGGMGVILYGCLWLALPPKPTEELPVGLAAAERHGRRRPASYDWTDTGVYVALGVIGLGLAALLASAIGQGFWFWPVALAVAGIAVLWRQADQAQRERWADRSSRTNVVRMVLGSGWAPLLRLLIGLLLIVTAVVLFSAGRAGLAAARDVGIALALVLLGIALIGGPWLQRLASDLRAERAERVRADERADLAALVHDSVLQTLALIQRSADDAETVSRLARTQERDLRNLLFAGPTTQSGTLAAALQALAEETEANWAVRVDLVLVGPSVATTGLDPLLLAVREALANAARHSGSPEISVYAEVSDGEVEVFVRDRGAGFDPESVPDDRHGIADSIIGRLERHGGAATARSQPGSGTEIAMRIRREAQ